MIDLSILGTVYTISASVTTGGAPALISHLPDDADGIDLPEIVIAEMVMGTNGDAISWSKAVPIPVTLNLIPNTTSFLTMTTILEANRAEKGKSSARDVLTLVRISPDGSTLTLTGGKIISGTPATSGASSGRLKTASYQMKFAKMLYVPSPEAALNI